MPESFDVFLSHNSRDKPAVEAIGRTLQARGLAVWLDKWELRPGKRWQNGLAAGIESSKTVAVFVGARGLGPWQKSEVEVFIDRATHMGDLPVIPVLLPGAPQEIELPKFLQLYTWVDLRDGITDENLNDLIWGITGDRPPTPTSLPEAAANFTYNLPVHNLPLPPLGALLHDREATLTRLHDALTRAPAGRATAIAAKAVHGLGGVGKTRLVVEYAWRHVAEYEALLFVGAESPEALRRNLAALCERVVLDLPEREAKEEEVQEAAVVRWLGKHVGWLLILDNVNSPEAAAAVGALITHLHGGHVLLTGRFARWGAEVEPIELDVLSEEAAAGFLLARTEERRQATPEDQTLATTLAHELGALPLALEQAGAYIAERRLTLAGYVDALRKRRDEVLAWFDPRVSHYPTGITVALQTSVDRLSAPARLLLERLAWLAPEPIPESLLDVAIPGLSQPEPDPHEALVELTTYSLATLAADAPTFTVHPLVQDLIRRDVEPNNARQRLKEALRWVDAAFAGNAQDVRIWATLEPIVPHASSVVAHADAAGLTVPTTRLMNELANYFQAKALFEEAEPLLHRALEINEASFGPMHPKVAINLNNLAQLLQSTGRLAEAEPLMRQALVVDEASLGPNHPAVATALSNLARLFQATRRPAEAEPLMRRALAIDETVFGREHPEVARDLNNLATLFWDTHRLTEAESLMRRALFINEASLGPEHPNVAIALNNLALLLQATHRLAEAELLMRRALAIDEASLGPEHPNIAIRLNNLARLLQITDRLDEAELLMRRHLLVFLNFTRRTGHPHPHLQAAFGNYRHLLKQLGKSEAEIETILEELKGGGRPQP